MIDGMIAPLGGVKVIASRLLTVTETADLGGAVVHQTLASIQKN